MFARDLLQIYSLAKHIVVTDKSLRSFSIFEYVVAKRSLRTRYN